MRLKVEAVSGGLHPRESVVIIQTAQGRQALSVDPRSIKDGSIEVGTPISKHKNYFLVELPVETDSGAWRVWVDENIVKDVMEAAE